MKSYHFIKELLRGFLVGNLLFFAWISYYYVTDATGLNIILDEFWEQYAGALLMVIILYLVNTYWFYFIRKKFNGHFYTFGRISLAILGNVIVSCFGFFIAGQILVLGVYDQSLNLRIELGSWTNYLQPTAIGLVFAFVFYGINYYKNRQEKKIEEQRIIAGTASAKFDALKNQLDPHFLFNSLNVLASLIDENPQQAQKFTTSLSKVYRYVLEQKNKDLISVDEELQFAKTYVRLLKMRFEDSIVFHIPETSRNPEAKIVPLSLQLLLENAVKHNVVTAERPLHIQVSEEDDMLVVRNNLQEKQTVKKSSGVGLVNIRQRYGILTDRKVEIEKSTSDFYVRLPILSRQISVMESQEEYITDKRYEKARERVEAIKGFYGNLLAYCIVIPFLAFINLNSTSFIWFIFPALGWGFGLTMHGMKAFGYNPLWGKRWEEKKMREFMEDDRF